MEWSSDVAAIESNGNPAGAHGYVFPLPPAVPDGGMTEATSTAVDRLVASAETSALGAMSIVPMVVLAAVVMTEKFWIKGENFSRLVGVASLALAIGTIWIPGLAPGFRME